MESSSRRFRTPRHSRRHDRNTTRSETRYRDKLTNPSPTSSTNEYSSKVQALISAARDLAGFSSTTHVATTTIDGDSKFNDAPNGDNSSAHDYSGFLAALGCPKE